MSNVRPIAFKTPRRPSSAVSFGPWHRRGSSPRVTAKHQTKGIPRCPERGAPMRPVYRNRGGRRVVGARRRGGTVHASALAPCLWKAQQLWEQIPNGLLPAAAARARPSPTATPTAKKSLSLRHAPSGEEPTLQVCDAQVGYLPLAGEERRLPEGTGRIDTPKGCRNHALAALCCGHANPPPPSRDEILKCQSGQNQAAPPPSKYPIERPPQLFLR